MWWNHIIIPNLSPKQAILSSNMPYFAKEKNQQPFSNQTWWGKIGSFENLRGKIPSSQVNWNFCHFVFDREFFSVPQTNAPWKL